MKKLLLILLVGILAISVFACTDTKNTRGNGPENTQSMYIKIDTLIQDSNGEHKCVWEDGEVFFNDFGGRGYQTQKSALLNIQTEYDMWLGELKRELDYTLDFQPPEFEYDKTKFEIKANPDKENHFLLKVLQSCDKEKIIIKLTDKHILDGMVDEDGNPIRQPFQTTLWVIISTVE